MTKLKIVCLSDTHCQHQRLVIPNCDLLLHSGDFTYKGTYLETLSFLNWFSVQSASHRVYICGNHELELCSIHGRRQSTYELTNLFKDSCVYLENSSTTCAGIKVFGTPVTPWFYDWAFNARRDDDKQHMDYPSIRDIYNNIPLDAQILIVHGPPYGILDETERDGRVGSKELLDIIEQRPALKLVVCGHLHLNGGQTYQHGNTLIVNAASLGENYRDLNKLIELDMEF